MKKVVVVMSAYNGAQFIEKQIRSIFAQKDVDVNCLIRDDGSKDDTLDKLEELKNDFKKIDIIRGENVGWEKSFLLALKAADDAEYYAFSDQDDIWFENKLIKEIKELEKHDNEKPLMVHCNRISCDEKLVPIKPAPKLARPLNRKNALVQEYAQGCTIVLNKKAKELVTRSMPKCKIPHDMWTGMICYLFGEVYYLSDPLFYHINHENNASGAGHIYKSRLGRLKKIIKGGSYPNAARDILDIYGDLISKEDEVFLKRAAGACKNISDRVNLLFDFDFRRKFLIGTLSLKYVVLRGRF